MYDQLMSRVGIRSIQAKNRVWMAPLTRARASMPGNVPNELMVEYYAQRAGAGVIIAEATPVTPWGYGYYATPGIHTDEQVAGWKMITDAVHAKGGKIVLQLWHVGRVSHCALLPDGGQPVSSTDVISESMSYIDDTLERVKNTPPRKLTTGEIPGVVEEFRDGAQRAKAAGFDGVEIHGANSYLLDQFTRDGVNKRDDIYGGSIENRIRFPLMVADAVADVWKDEDATASRVGYRISPMSEHKDVRDSDPESVFCALAKGLGERKLGFLHAVETWDRPNIDPRVATVMPKIVKAFKDAGGGLYIGNGNYTPEQAEQALVDGWADAIAFGKLWISNPDLDVRIASGGPYRDPEPSTFYGGGAAGYTEFSRLDES